MPMPLPRIQKANDLAHRPRLILPSPRSFSYSFILLLANRPGALRPLEYRGLPQHANAGRRARGHDQPRGAVPRVRLAARLLPPRHLCHHPRPHPLLHGPFVCVCLCLSVCLFVCLSVCLPVRLSVCVPGWCVCLPACLCTWLVCLCAWQAGCGCLSG